MPKLFLTYAWEDNQDRNVDQVVKELNAAGVEVAYDRAEFGVGDRLWEQIDAAIRDKDTSGWAIFLSEQSLNSEACLEELSYALIRALKAGAGNFPMITIMAGPVDWEKLPTTLRTRLGVSLEDQLWAQRISDRLHGKKTVPDFSELQPVGIRWHQTKDGWWLEVWPRAARWDPFEVVVEGGEPMNKFGIVQSGIRILTRGPRDRPPADGTYAVTTLARSDGRRAIRIPGPVDATTHGYVFVPEIPEMLSVGDSRTFYTLRFNGQPITD